MTPDLVDELATLIRLADAPTSAMGAEAMPRCGAMAVALAIRLKALADGVRLVQDAGAQATDT
jgi:hypothetical protein